MKIVVLVKQVPDTWIPRRLHVDTGLLDRDAGERIIDEIGERALEIALVEKDRAGAEVVAVTMGPDAARDALRRALAMGADSAVHVLDDRLQGADLAQTARVLAAVIRSLDADLIVAGNESTDGRGGVLPAMLAEHLGLPHATSLDSVEIDGGGVRGSRATEYGSSRVSADLPAIISITERSAEPRFPSFKGILTAKKKPVRTVSVDGLVGIVEADGVSATRIESVAERPARSAGIKITNDGTAAVQLADFLGSRL
jgi:electron transfer flavoprotein beta subunit